VSTLASLVERVRRTPPWLADLILAVAILGVGIADILFFQEDFAPFRVAPGLAIPLFAAMSLPLAIRRRNILLAYILIEAAIVATGQLLLISAINIGFLLVANVLLFSVGEQSSGMLTGAATLAQLGEIYTLYPRVPPEDRTYLNDALYFLPFFGFAAFAGWAQRRRKRLTVDLERSLAEVQRERELLAGQAVAQERIRIAGELRELVASGVDRMVSQAEAARTELHQDPAGAQRQIGAIEQAGRRTLVDMRRLLGVLRRADVAADQGSSDAVIEQTSPVGSDLRDAAGGPSHALWISIRRWLADPRVADVLIVAVLGGLMTLEFIRSAPDDQTMSGLAPHVLGPVIVLSLLFRRRFPFSVLTIAAAAEFLWIMITTNAPGSADRSLLVAVYSVAAYKGAGWTPVAVLMGTASWSLLPIRQLCICLIDIGALSTFAVIAGYSMQSGRKLNRQLSEQADVLRRTREERVRLAVSEERMRVARDMHDVVAHGVTVMVVQAGGARMIAGTDPALAAETLADIERIGAEAIGELRSLVGSLDPGGQERDPHGEVPNVGALVDRLRRTGQQISLVEDGEPHSLDLGVQISVYRIVQEALTNVRKHAPGSEATVAIRHLPERVELEIINRPIPDSRPARSVPGAGQGLLGIRERTAIFGGTVEAGSSADGGFRVAVRLPLELVPA
jgi:signal transduction histidine kinase